MEEKIFNFDGWQRKNKRVTEYFSTHKLNYIETTDCHINRMGRDKNFMISLTHYPEKYFLNFFLFFLREKRFHQFCSIEIY